MSTVVSILFHVLLITLLLEPSTRQAATRLVDQTRERVIPTAPLYFAPPVPVAKPRVPAPEIPTDIAPASPLTEGPDQTPGNSAKVSPVPEPEPNAQPDAKAETATRPDPGDAPDAGNAPDPSAVTTTVTPVPTAEENAAAMVSEAQRLFGRPSARLGGASGTIEQRPWETTTPSSSRGCTLPPEDTTDASVPRGMAVIAGRIYREGSGEPLAGARLQILGTPYGAFSDGRGFYKLMFARELVSQCRTQMVRVSAPGYRGRDVILYMGETGNSDVPMSRF